LHAPEKLFPKNSPSQQEAWAQLEALQAEGLTKSIGVSNHRVSDIKKILETCKVKPAINQIELNPYIYNEAKEIVDFCHENGIKIAAYSPSSPLVHFKSR
jgi:diketogulonate reductase-like aldo/keto reductase